MKIWIITITIIIVAVSADKDDLSNGKNNLDSNKKSSYSDSAVIDKKSRKTVESLYSKLRESEKRIARSAPKGKSKKPDLGPILNFFLTQVQCLRMQLLTGEVNLNSLFIYAERTLNLISCAYSNGVEDLNFDLSILWNHKVRDYLPRVELPRRYLSLMNSMHEPPLNEDLDLFLNQLRSGLIGRNRTQYLPVSYFHRLAAIHVEDPAAKRFSHDNYVLYRILGIHAQDYLFEFHVIEGYRVLFAILEIIEELLNEPEDTCLNDTTALKVPERVIELLRNNPAYSRFLLEKKHKELSLSGSGNSQFKDNLIKEIRVSDQDLAMLTWARIKKILRLKAPRAVVGTSTTTTPNPNEDKVEENVDIVNQGTSSNSLEPRIADICSDPIMCSDGSFHFFFVHYSTNYTAIKKILREPLGQCILKKPRTCELDNESPGLSGLQATLNSWKENRNVSTSSSEEEEEEESTGSSKKPLQSSGKGKTWIKPSLKCSSKKPLQSSGKGKTWIKPSLKCSSKKPQTSNNLVDPDQPGTSGSQPRSTYDDDDEYFGYFTRGDNDLTRDDDDLTEELKMFFENMKFDPSHPFN